MVWLIRKIPDLHLIFVSLFIGLAGGFILFFLKLFRIVEVRGYERWKFESRKGMGVFVIHRHPSMLEPVVIPMMLWRMYLSHPLNPPLLTPDQKNFFRNKGHWWFWAFLPFRPIGIPVDRDSKMGGMRAAYRIRRMLGQGRIVVTAPEGGRTWKGRAFKMAGVQEEFSLPEGRVDLQASIIRRFKPGIGGLAKGMMVVPVWVCPSGFGIRIIVGMPSILDSNVPSREADGILESMMLQTAVS